MSKDRKPRDQGDLAVVTKKKPKTRKPKLFNVLIYNDDYTTMEFVVQVLETIFRHSPSAAAAIMLAIHNTGRGVAGTYSREVAETKVEQVHAAAERSGYPLRASFEPAS